MKKITTLIVALTLVSSTFAQRQSSQPQMGADSKLLSQTTQGDYTVSRYLVKESSDDNNEFSVKYRINLTRLISTYDNNAEEIMGLKSFIRGIEQDTLKTITAVNVAGYASPDGPVALNQRLAMARANDFRQYLDSQCGMSKYGGSTTADAQKWSATIDAIRSSAMPNKSTILEIVSSLDSMPTIEAKLEAIPESWNYMKTTILPPMRCVELEVRYNSWKVVESRTATKSCKPQSATNIQNNYFILIEDDDTGMIINPTNSPLDYENCKCRDKAKFNRRRDIFKEREKFRRPHDRHPRREYLYERERFRF